MGQSLLPLPRFLGRGRLPECRYLCAALVLGLLSSSRGGFSSGKEGGKKAKVNKRKCADESEQVACGAASQGLLAGV